MPFYNEFEQYNSDMQDIYDFDNYSSVKYLDDNNCFYEINDEENTNSNNFNLLHLNFTSDDYIIIGIIVVLFIYGNIDTITLVALGILLFFNH